MVSSFPKILIFLMMASLHVFAEDMQKNREREAARAVPYKPEGTPRARNPRTAIGGILPPTTSRTGKIPGLRVGDRNYSVTAACTPGGVNTAPARWENRTI